MDALRIALVTGASRGLGLAMAEGLAEAGAIVAVNGRSADVLDGIASALRSRGLKAEIAPFDVTDQRAGQHAIDAIIARHGRLDILVANAGINHRVPLPDWTPADWDRLLTANLKACFFLAQQAAVPMRKQRHGRIIFTTSIAALWHGVASTVTRRRKAGLLALIAPSPANLASMASPAMAFAPAISKPNSRHHICRARRTWPGSTAGCPFEGGENHATLPVSASFLHRRPRPT